MRGKSETANPPPGIEQALVCENCGRTFRPAGASRVPRCPRCGSARCAPTQRTVAGQAVTAKAAVEDDRFARLALWGKLITSEQFAECVAAQRAMAERGEDVPSLPSLLIEKGYLSHDQAQAVFRAMTTRTPEQWRNHFGQIALRRGFIDERQLREGLEIQTRLILSQGSAPFLGHILLERGHLTERQVLEILKVQERHRLGALHELQRRLAPRGSRLRALARAHPRATLVAALVVALAVLSAAVGLVLGPTVAPGDRILLICDHCGYTARLAPSAISEPCPRCHRGAMCTPLWCEHCKVAFPLKVHTSETGEPWVEGCPVCGRLEGTKLPPELRGLRVRPRPSKRGARPAP